MKTALLLASIASLAACSVYDTPPEQGDRERRGIVGHRGGVAVYAGEADALKETASAGASITDIARPDTAPPATPPAAAPAKAPAPPAAAPATAPRTGTTAPDPACEPGQTDCEPAPPADAPPAR